MIFAKFDPVQWIGVLWKMVRMALIQKAGRRRADWRQSDYFVEQLERLDIFDFRFSSHPSAVYQRHVQTAERLQRFVYLNWIVKKFPNKRQNRYKLHNYSYMPDRNK